MRRLDRAISSQQPTQQPDLGQLALPEAIRASVIDIDCRQTIERPTISSTASPPINRLTPHGVWEPYVAHTHGRLGGCCMKRISLLAFGFGLLLLSLPAAAQDKL